MESIKKNDDNVLKKDNKADVQFSSLLNKADYDNLTYEEQDQYYYEIAKKIDNESDESKKQDYYLNLYFLGILAL